MRHLALLLLVPIAVAGCSDGDTTAVSADNLLSAVTGGSGAIWTTRADCSATTEQNRNEFAIGDYVYIHGEKFAAGDYEWAITGNPNSGDPNAVVASNAGSNIPLTDSDLDPTTHKVKVTGSGSFCFPAYRVGIGDDGVYKFNVGDKNDNYHTGGIEYSKTVAVDLNASYTWTIAKSATANSTLNLFAGDEGVAAYKVDLVRTGPTNVYVATGKVTIENTNRYFPTSALVVEDCLQYAGGDGVWHDIKCQTLTPAGGTVIPMGSTVEIPYTIEFDPSGAPAGASFRNQAKIMLLEDVGTPVFGEALAPFPLPGSPTKTVNATVTVSDAYDPSSPRTISGTTSYTYNHTFTCSDAGKKTNTATIVETKQTASADVTVNCRTLSVTKTAATSLTRTYSWTIDKLARDGDPGTRDLDTLTLGTGVHYTGYYSVKLGATSVDSDWAVKGKITVENAVGNVIAAKITGVVDTVTTGLAGAVTGCVVGSTPVTFPYSLLPGETMTCDYTRALPDATTRTNTATADREKTRFNANGTTSAIGTAEHKGTASVSFASATIKQVHGCVDLTDTQAATILTSDMPAQFCALPAEKTITKTFKYTTDIIGGSGCKDSLVDNTVKFVATDDAKVTGSDTWSIKLHIPCPQCTLTQGYWKNHSIAGKAPADTIWDLLPDNSATPFAMPFTADLSGLGTWLEVFRTPPKGNAYFNLAHQWMAAQLNILRVPAKDGPAILTDEIKTALAEGQTLLEKYAGAARVDIPDADRALMIEYAGTLAWYNEGNSGVPHCDEQNAEMMLSTNTSTER